MAFGALSESLERRDEESLDIGVSENLGITRPRDRGVFKEFRKGAAKGVRNLQESVLSTAEELGNDDAGDALQRLEVEDNYLKANEPAPGGLNKAANIIGQGVEQLPNYALMAAGAVASGGIGLAPAAGRIAGLGVGVFSRAYGPRRKELKAKGLTDLEATLGSMMSVGLEIGLESAIGAEAIIGKNLDGLTSRLLKQTTKKAYSQGALTAAAKGFRVLASYLGRFALIEAEEVMEENLALLGNALIDEVLAGDGEVTASEIKDTTYQTLLQTLPFAGGGALLSGGRQDARRKSIRESLSMPPTEGTLQRAYTKNGAPVDPAAMDASIQATEQVLNQRFTPEESAASTTLIRAVSENLAAMDETRSPEEFVEGIRIAFERGEVDQEAWNEANEIEDPQVRQQAKIDVLKATPTFGQEYYDITELALATQTKDDNDSRERELFGNRTEQDAAESLNNVVTPPEDSAGIFMVPSYAAVDEVQYEEVYRRGLVRGVQIDGETYTVHSRGRVNNPEGGQFLVRPGDLVFVKSTDVAPETAEVVDPRHEDMRSQFLDEAINVNSEWAYRSRKEGVQASVEAETAELEAQATARGELVDSLNTRLQQRATAVEVRDDLAVARERKAEQGQKQIAKFEARKAKSTASARKVLEAAEDSPAKVAALKSFDDIEVGTFPVTTPDTAVVLEEGARATKEKLAEQKAQGEEQIRKFRERQAQAIATAKTQATKAVAPEQQEKVIKSFDDLAATLEEQTTAEDAAVAPDAREATNPIQQELFRREDLAAEGVDATGWFSEETTARAFYDRGTRSLHFFNSATADDIVHEWFHHLTETTGLMPARSRDVLVQHYTDEEGNWQPEQAVQGLLSYMRDKVMPEGAPQELAQAFATMHKTLAGSAQAAAGVVNDETLAAFEQMFGFVVDPAFVEDGAAVQARAEHAQQYAAEEDPAEAFLSEEPDRRTVVRYTDEQGRGLLNNDVINRELLTADEEAELIEEMDLGLEQPRDVPADATFAFTEEGEETHSRLLELLTKASNNGVVRTEVEIAGVPVWESNDGQVAFQTQNTEGLFSEEPITTKPPASLTEQDLKNLRGRHTVGMFAKSMNLSGNEARAQVRDIATRLFNLSPDAEGSVLRQLSGAQLQELHRTLRAVGESERTRRYDGLAQDKFGVDSYEDLKDNREKEAVRQIDAAESGTQKAVDNRSEATKLNAKELSQYATDLAGRTEEELRARPTNGPGEAPGSGKPGALGQASNYLKILHHDLKRFRAGIFNRIMTHTYGLQDMLNVLAENNPKSVFMEMRTVVENMGRRLVSRTEQSIAKIQEFHLARGLKHLPQTLGRPIELAGKEYSQEEAIAVAMVTRGDTSKNERGEYNSNQIEALYASNGEDLVAGGTRENFDALINDAWAKTQANKELSGVMGTMDDYYAWIKGEIDTERAAMGLGNIGDVVGYFPLMREGGMFVNVDAIAASMGITPEKMEGIKSTDARFKKRSATYGGRIRLDALNVFDAYRKQADIYIAKEASVNTLQKALADSSEMFTRRGLSQERHMLDDLLRAERHANGRYTPMDPIEIAIRAFGSKYKLSIFGGNMPSAFKQVFSAANGAALLPAMDSWRIAANLMGMSKYAMRFGAKSWPNIMQGHPTWEMMIKGNSEHTQSQYIATEIGLTGAPRGIAGVQVKGVPLRDILLLPQRHMDMLARTAVWGATYDSQRRQTRQDPSMTDQQKHEAAFREAERVTRETQPAATISDRAAMQKSNEWVRAITPFTGQLFKNWNLARTRMYLPMKQAWEAGMTKGGPLMALNEVSEVARGSKYAREQYNMTTGTAQIFGLAFVAPALALSTLARGRPPKDWDEFMGDLLAYNVSMIPGFGPFISSKLLFDKWSSDGAPLYFEFINGAAEVVRAAVKGDKDVFTEEGLRLAARSTGFPSKMVRFLEKTSEGQFEKGKEPDWKAITTWYLFGEKME